MWNWRVLKTMLMASTVNLGIGALLLALHLAPAVYWVPSGTPTILFGGLASHNMLLYVLVMIGLLALDVVIFWRVVQELHKSGEVAYAWTLVNVNTRAVECPLDYDGDCWSTLESK